MTQEVLELLALREEHEAIGELLEETGAYVSSTDRLTILLRYCFLSLTWSVTHE